MGSLCQPGGSSSKSRCSTPARRTRLHEPQGVEKNLCPTLRQSQGWESNVVMLLLYWVQFSTLNKRIKRLSCSADGPFTKIIEFMKKTSYYDPVFRPVSCLQGCQRVFLLRENMGDEKKPKRMRRGRWISRNWTIITTCLSSSMGRGLGENFLQQTPCGRGEGGVVKVKLEHEHCSTSK